MLEPLLRLIAPHTCVICSQDGEMLCTACATNLPAAPYRCYNCSTTTDSRRLCLPCLRASSFDDLAAATIYKDAAKELLYALKFGRARAAAEPMARAMASRLGSIENLTEYVVTYAPTAPARVRVRGYDQAARLAQALARQTGLPCRPMLTRNTTARQLGQTRTNRLQQMSGAFQVRPSATVTNRRIILVDDVITTGATLESAARVLKGAGATDVLAAVFAIA